MDPGRDLSGGKGEPRLFLAAAVDAAKAGAEVLRHYFRSADLDVRAKEANDFVTRADHESEERILRVLRGRFPDHRILAEESGRVEALDGRGEGGDGGAEAVEWIVDPLDGTSNYLHGLPVFCISIGCRRGENLLAGVVYDPIGDELFTASRGGGAHWNGRPVSVSTGPGLAGAFLATGYPFRARGALDLYLDVFREVFQHAGGVRRCGAAALDLAYTAAGVYDGFFEFRLSPWDLAAGVLLVKEAGGRVSDLDGGEGYFQGGNVVAGGPGVHAELLAAVRSRVSEGTLEEADPRAE
ncbi:MAG: inositol monophosphatase family protein [Acidobacteriota bacterium]